MLIASKISRENGFKLPPPGKRCFLYINDTQRIEMKYRLLKGKAKGIVWYFICPVSGKPCLRLYLKNGLYVHRTEINNFARLNKPLWYSESKLNRVLVLKQRAIDADKLISKRYFKKHYRGKPTRQYSKCLRQIEAAKGITEFDIINGKYDK